MFKRKKEECSKLMQQGSRYPEFKGDLSCSFPALHFHSGTSVEQLCMIHSNNKQLIYLLLVLRAAAQFILCLKKAVLAPVSLRPPLMITFMSLIGYSLCHPAS